MIEVPSHYRPRINLTSKLHVDGGSLVLSSMKVRAISCTAVKQRLVSLFRSRLAHCLEPCLLFTGESSIHPVGTWREAMVRFRTSSYDSSLPGFSLTLSGMRMSERKLRSGSREDPEKNDRDHRITGGVWCLD